MSYYYALLASAAVLWLVYRYVTYRRGTSSAIPPSNEKKNASGQENPLKAYQDIEPLHDFDWESTPPMKLRPFKPKYHLTMALEMISLSDLLQMDKTYLSRIKLRRQLMNDHPDATLACNDVAGPAALELYDWLVGTYLPKRFPTCFSLVVKHEATAAAAESDSNNRKPPPASIPNQQPTHLLNHITSEHIPLHQSNPLTALHALSSHIDTDFLILLPQHQTPTTPQEQPSQPTYHLQSFTTTFPSGFSTLSKLSLPLSAIHAPVPSYMPKLSKSMDRFFARLPLGQLARRANWTITTTPDLFTESGTHMHDAASLSPEEAAASIAAQKEGLDVDEMRLRCELQTLFRLPESKALVFAFKTYQYGLGEVKAEEGMGEALAEATEGFARGSVPEMSVYKREAVWGDAVREFMRKA
ncbi:hypothetical protein MBLNU13_g07348t3 [Cladosporium sp. NU13]